MLNRPLSGEDEEEDYPTVKICDFGLSHILSNEYNGKAMMTEKCGTGGYIAPEIG